MKIGIDARFYNPEASGLARYTSELVPRLVDLPAAKEHQFVIFLPSKITAPKVANRQVQFVSTDIKHYSKSEQFRFRRILESYDLDLTHFLNFNHPLFYRGRSIFTIHDIILSFYPGKNISPLKKLAYEVTIKHALKSAVKIIAVSQMTKRQLTEHYHVDPDKVKVIYEAVDSRYKKIDNQKLLDEIKKKYHIDKSYLLYVGQIRIHKNIVRLIEAFSSLHARNRSLQLVLVGKADPHYAPDVLAAIERHHLGNSVIQTGFTPEEDLPVLYSGASAAVVPSLIEGFGLPPLEAMACECPVISSNASCLPEIAGDGALYFDPLSPVDMADKINTVLTDENLRAILIKAGLKRIKDFSWDKMAEETLAVYESLGKEISN